MIKRETITVSGTVLYCDVCEIRGPESAYDNADEVLEAAVDKGWTVDRNDRDLCSNCSKVAR